MGAQGEDDVKTRLNTSRSPAFFADRRRRLGIRPRGAAIASAPAALARPTTWSRCPVATFTHPTPSARAQWILSGATAAQERGRATGPRTPPRRRFTSSRKTDEERGNRPNRTFFWGGGTAEIRCESAFQPRLGELRDLPAERAQSFTSCRSDPEEVRTVIERSPPAFSTDPGLQQTTRQGSQLSRRRLSWQQRNGARSSAWKSSVRTCSRIGSPRQPTFLSSRSFASCRNSSIWSASRALTMRLPKRRTASSRRLGSRTLWWS